VTYTATMTALEKGLQWERALDRFDEMKFKNMPVTVVSYDSAISVCENRYQWRQCMDYLNEMTELGIAKYAIIFGAAISCLEKICRGKTDHASWKRWTERASRRMMRPTLQYWMMWRRMSHWRAKYVSRVSSVAVMSVSHVLVPIGSNWICTWLVVRGMSGALPRQQQQARICESVFWPCSSS
jgi:hypothetical protein